jgi:hypothetical protein
MKVNNKHTHLCHHVLNLLLVCHMAIFDVEITNLFLNATNIIEFY